MSSAAGRRGTGPGSATETGTRGGAAPQTSGTSGSGSAARYQFKELKGGAGSAAVGIFALGVVMVVGV